MAHKNTFGKAAVLATICFVALTLTREVHPLRGAALFAIGLFAVAQARSLTAWVGLAVCLPTCAYFARAVRASRPTPTRWRQLALALVLGVSVIPLLVAPLAAVLGERDPLNGRMHLWAGALTILCERPLTGYGYAVVWARSGNTLLPHIPITAHRSASSAHNSIVHVATELGIPAAVVACAYLFGALTRAGRLLERAPSAFSLFALVFLIGFTLMGFTEAHLLQTAWMLWILFVAVTITVARALEAG